MNTKKLIAVGITAIAALVAFAEPTVTDVVAKQRYPSNGLVDITCKGAGINGIACEAQPHTLRFSLCSISENTEKGR